jgi:hypothetical protein
MSRADFKHRLNINPRPRLVERRNRDDDTHTFPRRQQITLESAQAMENQPNGWVSSRQTMGTKERDNKSIARHVATPTQSPRRPSSPHRQPGTLTVQEMAIHHPRMPGIAIARTEHINSLRDAGEHELRDWSAQNITSTYTYSASQRRRGTEVLSRFSCWRRGSPPSEHPIQSRDIQI